MTLPANPEEARAVAREYVREMLATGYGSDRAADDVCSRTAPGESGWDIRGGRITVPSFGKNRWTFAFSELEAEVRGGAVAEQLTLF